MHQNKVRVFINSLFESSLLVALLMPLFSTHCLAQNPIKNKNVYPAWAEWKTVGYSTLKWGFWDIYDARLKTPSGLFHTDKSYVTGTALLIDYRRKISKKQLLLATDEQFVHLGVSRENRKRWIQELSSIWKGVREGDRLVFVLMESGGRFYFGNDFLGQTKDMQLARTFMDIWLSDDTAYPELRQQLIGTYW